MFRSTFASDGGLSGRISAGVLLCLLSAASGPFGGRSGHTSNERNGCGARSICSQSRHPKKVDAAQGRFMSRPVIPSHSMPCLPPLPLLDASWMATPWHIQSQMSNQFVLCLTQPTSSTFPRKRTCLRREHPRRDTCGSRKLHANQRDPEVNNHFSSQASAMVCQSWGKLPLFSDASAPRKQRMKGSVCKTKRAQIADQPPLLRWLVMNPLGIQSDEIVPSRQLDRL